MAEVSTEELSRLLPPRDRRRGKRVLTLRNTRNFALIALLCFVVLSVIFEFRRGEPGEFGRLYARRTRRVEIQPRHAYTVIQERHISDQTGADPLLLEAARRQQYLGVTDADLQRMRESAQRRMMTEDPSLVLAPGGKQPVLQQNSDRETARIEITGGPEGVYVKKD